jgi:hypothetical protein|tara:strand:+ start:2178 stop:2468 length:291 start_codon:yes stop_codon:yes gene_type:complete
MNNPKTIRIKSLYMGRVAIRDKYLAEFNENGKDLVFEYKGLDKNLLGEKMTIRNSDIAQRVVAKSEEQFLDRYSNSVHHLLYFDWKNDDNKQDAMF